MKIKLTNANDKVLIEKSNGTSSEVATKADISAITKSDIGLGNVGNFKAVSTEAEQGLSNTEKANARNNIGVPELIGDDTARANWGGDWRMPTKAEFQALRAAINTEWTTNYQSSGVVGLICTDKTDSSKVLFFPATSRCEDGIWFGIPPGHGGCNYWSSSLSNFNKKYACNMTINSDLNLEGFNTSSERSYGYTVRPILDGANANGYTYVMIGGLKWATMNIGASLPSDYGLYFQWGDTQGYTADQVGEDNGQKYFGWADYKYGNGTDDPDATDLTKYNATDGKTVLELSTPVDYLHKVAVTGDYNDLNNKPTNVAVSTEANQGLTDTEKSNARTNIGAGTSSFSGSYNDLTNKPVIPEVADGGDDAARANWGGDWRMPTTEEFQALGAAVNAVWTTNYNESDYNGLLCTDKTDSSKVLFFPAAGYCVGGNVKNVGSYGDYWSNSLHTSDRQRAYSLYFESNRALWNNHLYRHCGYAVRPILDGANANGHEYVEIGGLKWATMNIGANSVTDYGLYFQWGDVKGYTASQVGSGTGQKYFGGADYKYGNGTSSPGAAGMTKYNSTDGLTTLKLSTPVEYLHKVAVTGDYNDLSSRPDVSGMIETTYSNLVSLRNNSQLIPGKWYRITDYQCTTTQENTQSAGHQFDIIVRADDVNVLNENAYAAKHTGDTYFANSKLDAWELKYTLDNDTNRFAWADSTNGKGVIYWMKDERDNECPYDFKNILYVKQNEPGFVVSFGGSYDSTYLRDSSLDSSGYYGFRLDSGYGPNTLNTTTLDLSTSTTLYYGTSRFDYGVITSIIEGSSTVFTFDKQGSDDSLNSLYIRSNCIKSYKFFDNKQRLNRILFETSSNGSTYFYNNTFGNDCHDNTFVNSCNNNIFGTACFNNIIDSSYVNTFGNDCHDNKFGEGCYLNTFGNNCNNNTFGNSCYNNTFGENCSANTFGEGCTHNSFGNNCSNNTFWDNCYQNSFLNQCLNNTFNTACLYNTFGNACISNNLLSYDTYNVFGNSCSYITFAHYCSKNIVESGNSNIVLSSTLTTSSSHVLRNVKIAQGVNFTTTLKIIYHSTLDDTFQTEYKPTNSQVISV